MTQKTTAPPIPLRRPKVRTYASLYGSRYQVILSFSRYMDTGQTSIVMVEADAEGRPTHELVARITVSIQGEPVKTDGTVFIKDWSEGEGMMQWLEEQGICYPPHAHKMIGFVSVPVARLKIAPPLDGFELEEVHNG